MNLINYNIYKTHDFLPENSSDKIEPSINANKFGTLNQCKQVINLSIRVRRSIQYNYNRPPVIKRSSSNIFCFHQEKFFNAIDDNNQKTENSLLIEENQKAISKESSIFNKNAICVLFLEDFNGNKEEFARTEVIWNQDEPNWVKGFTIEILPDMKKMLCFQIYEIISNNRNIEQQKLLAVASVELSVLMNSIKNYIQVPLSIIRSNEESYFIDLNYYEFKPDVEGSYVFTFRVDELHSQMRIIKSPKPYFIIKRMNESSNHYMNVYKSDVFMKYKNKTAEWKYVILDLQALCGGNFDLPLRISLYDYLSTKHVQNKNGYINTTLRKLIEKKSFEFIDKNGKVIAFLHTELLSKIERPCFFDLKLKGMKIRPILGIDFSSTKINDVDSNRLLHFKNNEFSYISSITEIYDSIHEIVKNQSFTSYAFADFKGEKVIPLFSEKDKMTISEKKNEFKISHLTINSIADSYNYSKHHITYPEHSLLEPLIDKALIDAQANYETDGSISLLIIVSCGIFADFAKAMKKLADSDEKPLICLFVLMNGMKVNLYDSIVQRNGKLINNLGHKSKRKLAKVVIYSDGSTFSDNRLDKEIIPSIKSMATDFFRIHLNVIFF